LIPIAKPQISVEEIQAVTDVLKSGMLAQGKIVEKLEQEFASYIGVKYAIATNSGTSALHTALASLGIGKDDEVITTDFSFLASASCILMQQAKPVFCDIDPYTYNIAADIILDKITDKTKAILPVHLYGQSCDMSTINKIACEYDLFVVEDACQAHGAEYKSKKVGSIGDVGCFSLYPTKNITTGEGGIITTNDNFMAEKARLFRSHGQSERYLHDSFGYNYRMTDILAAIGLVQLKKLDQWNSKRRANARYLTSKFEKINGVTPPYISPYVKHAFHQYTVKIEDSFSLSRDDFTKYLKNKGISFGIHYPLPIHQQPVFQKLGYDDEAVNCPVSSEVSNKVVSLPVHPGLSRENLEYIVETTRLVEEKELWMSA
jgi:perosamine synthetase